MMTRLPSIASFDPFSGRPRLHGARRVGIRPGTELIHPIAATGDRPLHFEVAGLPPGIDVDEDGILRGTAPIGTGNHPLTVRVTNGAGTTDGTIELCVGDTLALTPPMGWNSWNVFRDDVSAELIIGIAETLVATGMRDLGYQYVNIDDHWHGGSRALDGTPVADPVRFPDGIAAVADRVHELGLKLGIYSDAAELTCGGCFGGLGYEDIDARTYAAWGVDLLKYDYCHAPAKRSVAVERYGSMGRELAASGRSIVFSVCEWGFRRPWRWAPQVGASYWRTTGDIFDTFTGPVVGVRSIARRTMRLADFAGPGRWNDPDMLLVGNRGKGLSTGVLQPVEGWRIRPVLWNFKGLTDEQARSHMTLWAMLAAPLLASHDLTVTEAFDLDLLRNPEILAIDQDALGQQARRRRSAPGTWVLVKPLVDGRLALSVTNLGRGPRTVTVDLAPLGLAEGAEVLDAWSMTELGHQTSLAPPLPGHGSTVYVCRPAGTDSSGVQRT